MIALSVSPARGPLKDLETCGTSKFWLYTGLTVPWAFGFTMLYRDYLRKVAQTTTTTTKTPQVDAGAAAMRGPQAE